MIVVTDAAAKRVPLAWASRSGPPWIDAPSLRGTVMTTITAAEIRPLEPEVAWTADEVADPERWTLQLDDGHLEELIGGVRAALDRHDDLLDITADDVPLPRLGPELATIERELMEGRGFARIAGLPVDELGEELATAAYWTIGRHLGEPWPQNAKGHVLGTVRDQGKALDDPTARGNEMGGVALPFHSDGSDLVGLMCLVDGVSGGESRIANVVTAHNRLVERDPDLVAALHEPLPYDFRGEQAPGQKPWYLVPAFTEHRGRLFVRYIPTFIRASQRHADAPRLTDRQVAAMAALDELIADADLQLEMTLGPGDIQFINNFHVVHGRRSYVDDPATGRVRYLKRLWLATSVLGPEDRPARFARPGAMDHWGDNRTRA